MTEEELATIRNQQVGFIFQSFHLLPRKTAVMNVELPLQYARVSADERQERALKLLRLVGLEDRVTHLPNQLSGGQQQRVAIARALANRPALLLADEPTGSLDSHSGMEILHLLRDLNQKGQTVLLVTHARELAQIARRLITLRDGEVISDEQIEVSPGERESQQPNAAGQEAR
jgi:putative ABC transport system ATP-binding protein